MIHKAIISLLLLLLIINHFISNGMKWKKFTDKYIDYIRISHSYLCWYIGEINKSNKSNRIINNRFGFENELN